MRPSVKDLAEKSVPTSPPSPFSADSVGEHEEPWRRGPPLRHRRLRTGWTSEGRRGGRPPPPPHQTTPPPPLFPQEIPPLPLQDSFGIERRQMQGEPLRDAAQGQGRGQKVRPLAKQSPTGPRVRTAPPAALRSCPPARED